jgi:hypothetical protein
MTTPRLLPTLVAALLAAAPLAAQADSQLSGTVLDATSGKAIPDAILRIADTNVSAVSDPEGHFVLRGLPVGPHTLEVQHPGFGEHSMAVSVPRPGERFSVVVRLSTEGMSIQILDAVPATGEISPEQAPTEPSRAIVRTEVATLSPGPHGGTVLDRARIQEAARSSRTLAEVIRQTVPSLRPRQLDQAGRTLCLEFRGATALSMRANSVADQCFNPLVFLDGVPLQDPSIALNMTAMQGVEWIQVLSPAEAGVQYGAAPYGVISITTTAGASRTAALGVPSAGFVLPSRRRTFDWSGDPEGHPLLRTAAGAVAGNLLGLAAGVAVGRECIYIEERTKEIEQSCSHVGVAGAGLTAFALPALGSAMGARWGGRTNTSQGKLVPAVVGAAMMIFPGYIFSLMTVGDGVQTMNVVGKGMLVIGTPALVTLADRMFRKLRD